MSALPSSDATLVGAWRVDTGDRADLAVPLRDYCRRFGFRAALVGPTAVRVHAGSEHELDLVVGLWARQNDIEVTVERLDAPPPELPAPAPVRAAPADALSKPRLGDLLVKKGFLTEDRLAAALAEARTAHLLLGIVLLRDHVIFEDELARTLSEQLSIPYVSIMRIGVDPDAVMLLPRDVGAAVAAIPTRGKGGRVQVAFADPTDEHALAEVRRFIPDIEPAVAELSDIELAWRSYGDRTQR
jgi:hypothetical protein